MSDLSHIVYHRYVKKMYAIVIKFRGKETKIKYLLLVVHCFHHKLIGLTIVHISSVQRFIPDASEPKEVDTASGQG